MVNVVKGAQVSIDELDELNDSNALSGGESSELTVIGREVGGVLCGGFAIVKRVCE